MTLLAHPGDPEGKLVPQLHETAAWLAGMSPDLFRLLMNKEPEVLLRSDVATADISDRAALVESLLRRFDAGLLLDRGLDVWRQYRKLSHPGLADQLRPYVCDSSKGIVVRRVAIHIAHACELQEIQEDLLKVALDHSQSSSTRISAAHALADLAGNETRVKLRALVTGDAGDDPDDELKGFGLLALWPDNLTSSELFSLLTLPKRESHLGVYQRFLRFDLPDKLKQRDLPIALDWVANQTSRHSSPHPFEELKDAIILKAWENIEYSGVLDLFVKAVLTRMRTGQEIIGRFSDNGKTQLVAAGNEAKRRLVVARLIQLATDEEDDILFWLVHGRFPLVTPQDALWLIEIIQETRSEVVQAALSRLVRFVLDWNNPDHLDAVVLACSKIPVLKREFEWFLGFVEFDSPRAEKMKAVYEEQQRWEAEGRKKTPLEPPPEKRIAELLEESEAGASAAFAQITLEMTLEPDGVRYFLDWSPDLTRLPGWKKADLTTRSRIIAAAKRYILHHDPKTSSWLGSNEWPIEAVAGYKALCLLLMEAPSCICTLPGDLWHKWGPLILAYPAFGGEKEQEQQGVLLKYAYADAPEKIIASLLVLIDKENAADRRPDLDCIKDCWDAPIANMLLEKARDGALKPACLRYLLEMLLDRQSLDARQYAESLVASPITAVDPDRKRALTAAEVLLLHTKDAGWSVIWPAIQQNSAFGRELISATIHGPGAHEAVIAECLSEDQVADLFVWLVRQYPYSEDLKIEGAHAVGSRESIATWRDSLLRHLTARGNYLPVAATQHIAQTLPELDWLKWTIQEAQAEARSQTWTAIRPSEFLRISSHSEKRLVQNADQLLAVLVESLGRLEAKFQGETPAAIDLWNEIGQNLAAPKDENRLSDYVKRYLDEDLRKRGIIVNREVEIRRGQQTDIRVDAVVPHHQEVYGRLTVIIETKGCWHRELETAMETQLLNRYMKENHCQHGIYLVGWFVSDRWDKADYKRGNTPKYSLDQARRHFAGQAAQLSQGPIRISSIVLNVGI